MPDILKELKKRLDAESAYMIFRFPELIKKEAPVSKTQSYMEYGAVFWGSMDSHDIMQEFVVSVSVPINTLCPCSKEISKYGAHNQRGVVKINVKAKRLFWIEDMINTIEKCASSDIYSILKREDEKFITEKAYENPKFVEDVVRDIADTFSKDTNIEWFAVEAENFESIHNHSAYAYLERNNKGGSV